MYVEQMLDRLKLISLGMPVWDAGSHEAEPMERENTGLEEMKAVIGSPLLEAHKWIIDELRAGQDVAGWGGVFYYNQIKDGTGLKKIDQWVIFPKQSFEAENFGDWVETRCGQLANEWEVDWVSFGINGRLYSDFEFGCEESLGIKGELGEVYYFKNSQAGKKFSTQKYLVGLDVDNKVSNEELVNFEKQSGSPFFVADSDRGHLILYPLIFDAKWERARETVWGILLQAKYLSRMTLDDMHLGMGMVQRETTLRVSRGIVSGKQPVVSGVVWGGQVFK
jgi:hypothetical protein